MYNGRDIAESQGNGASPRKVWEEFAEAPASKRMESENMKPLISGCKAVFIILIWACTAPLCVHAQTFNVLYSFSYAAQSGQDPLGQLVQASDGYLYGTTYTDANGGNGSIFKMDLSGNVTTVHYFNGSDGVSPNGDLIQATNGLIYGTCYQGGAYNGGTVWSLDPTSGMVTDLHDFTGYNYSNPVDSGGSGPEAGVTQASDGNLYGTTWYGGQYSGYSTLFELDLSGSSFNIIHSFDLYDDGLYPGGRLTEGKDGNLYGGVLEGGSTGYGLLFRVAKSGSSFTVLHTFAGPEGAYYNYGALLQLPDGNFYGTCYEGGVNNAGTIFQLNPTTESLTALYSFGGVNGESPGSGLTLGSDGMLYGDTDLGGKFGL